MDVIRSLDSGPRFEVGHAVTIGAYDGVHLGHQAVIGQTQARAAELGARTAVVTFDPHPAYVIRPESAPKILSHTDEKLELLAQLGVDTVVVVPFDETIAAETPEEFVLRVLVDCLQAKIVVVGHDFHFGKGRAGNVDLLSAIGANQGFDVVGLELVARSDRAAAEGTESVSSTAIRRALAGGEVGVAAALLGRHHELRGPVTEGDQRGRTIGFPTANVAIGQHMAMPADAVYAAWYIRPDGSVHPSAVNVGKRPTFYDNAEHSLLEAHLIDFDGDLYGEIGRVQFVELLRSEQRFDGIEALKAQLMLDIERARAVLVDASPD